MASDLRKKTQEAIDLLREGVAACNLAMLIDRETGLVLSKSSKGMVTQTKLEQLASSAQTELVGSLATALPGLGSDGDILTALYVGKDEIIVVLKSLKDGEDALVCEFTEFPNRADLETAASSIFNLSTEAEAA